MSKINVLEPNVFNMISAGEVVERPSSVVKELIENSIDAGASEVSVYVEDGGIRKIQVSDNGIGIEKDDMRKAFLPHATSKLKNIVDLDSLSTLGFRGEALASISSVSEVTLSSKSKNQDIASKITLSGGKVTFEGDDSRAEGTVISVENLFFNTPARLKFLKKGVSELNYVKDVVRMLILANPSVRIELSNEEGTLLRNEGGTLSDAIFSVYGAKTADNLLEICDEYGGAIKVSGFTSKVDYTKANRTYQTIIVNGRAVEDQTVQTAVEKAYSEYLMKRTYPMFVLDILMPFDDVDVNVHPSKTEVRFRDKHAVFSAVYHAVQNTINNSLKNVAFGFDVEQNPTENTQNATKQSDFSNNFDVEPVRKPQVNYAQSAIDTSKLFSGKTTPKNYFGFDIPSR
ncbi:MAG TPA: DNA mismatch repair endonuclease MutL, partial [Clostridiales bacterium]|nr:DNA mismatch repair endonuclease MutL [Clostridiales bacterium]